MIISPLLLQTFIRCFQRKGVFAYPTEAVFGLGCDPASEVAAMNILTLKKRPIEKGMILVASRFEQLLSYVDMSGVAESAKTKMDKTWPGPVTWLVPKATSTPYYLTGDSDFIAVRVSSHPVVTELCESVNSAIVSTSANPANLSPAKSADEVDNYFRSYGELLSLIVDGHLGDQVSPSKIVNALTQEIIRA